MAFKISIDKEACIGCGACVATCDSMFKLGNDGKAEPKKASVEKAGCAKEAAESCPVNCITVQ